jgi:hypothetical protein
MLWMDKRTTAIDFRQGLPRRELSPVIYNLSRIYRSYFYSQGSFDTMIGEHSSIVLQNNFQARGLDATHVRVMLAHPSVSDAVLLPSVNKWVPWLGSAPSPMLSRGYQRKTWYLVPVQAPRHPSMPEVVWAGNIRRMLLLSQESSNTCS